MKSKYKKRTANWRGDWNHNLLLNQALIVLNYQFSYNLVGFGFNSYI